MKTFISKERQEYEMLLRKYRKSVVNSVLFTIGCPVLAWLILETFFK